MNNFTFKKFVQNFEKFWFVELLDNMQHFLIIRKILKLSIFSKCSPPRSYQNHSQPHSVSARLGLGLCLIRSLLDSVSTSQVLCLTRALSDSVPASPGSGKDGRQTGSYRDRIVQRRCSSETRYGRDRVPQSPVLAGIASGEF